MSNSVEKHDTTQPGKPRKAPGKPGAKPRWSSGAKAGVGTSVSKNSRVWFTVGSGAVNEVYFPDVDKANTRSVRFLVTDDRGFFSNEMSDTSSLVRTIGEGVPGYLVESTCREGRYRLTKEIISDPARDCLLVRVQFEVLQSGSPLHLYLEIDPHLKDCGEGNTAWVGQYKGIPMLFAARDTSVLAAVCTVPYLESTCGYIGRSDGLTDLKQNGKLTELYNVAPEGNVALCAKLDWQSSGGSFVLSLAFGSEPAEAGLQARAGMLQPFSDARERFVREWQEEHAQRRPAPQVDGVDPAIYPISTAMLACQESKCFPGGFIASLSIPWGFAKGDKDIGGYHVLWPRDLAEVAMGRLAAGDPAAARSGLFYLACTQKEDGSWSQNMWLDGTEHWSAEQMDGIAIPILLADQLRRAGELGHADPWPMIRNAVSYLVQNGPVTAQDRWEAVPGYTVYTMACEVAALLAAADFADDAGEPGTGQFLRETADAWNDAIDSYTYVTGTKLAREHGVEGYYVRIMPRDVVENRDPHRLRITLPNHLWGTRSRRAVEILSPDALALVRFGLRSAHDPRLLSTVKLLDATLKRELSTGPGWIRSTDDGYGEHSDGAPFNGRGIGRCWPLLAGERAHFAVAGGDREMAGKLAQTISRQTSAGGMIPEQVWDAPDIPQHQLFNGHPTGSGMPLAWAHAEFVKLLRSIEAGQVWDMPPQPVERYQVQQRSSPFEIWNDKERRAWVTPGKSLRVDLRAAAEVRWRFDGEGVWQTARTGDPVLGVHSCTIHLPRQKGSWRKLAFELWPDGGKRSRHTVVPRSGA